MTYSTTSRIIIAANPSYATEKETAFWTHFERLCQRSGWVLFKHAMRKIPADGQTMVMPARLSDVSKFLGDPTGFATTDSLPKWFSRAEFDRILEWEVRRWQLSGIDESMRLGLRKLAWHVHSLFDTLRPAGTIVTNKIDHGTALFFWAAKHFGSQHLFLERSPLESFIIESEGMFAESNIWSQYPGFETARRHLRNGESWARFLQANTDGFRKQNFDNAPTIDALMKFPGPRVFLPFDNTLWTGWAQEGHLQAAIDYYPDTPSPAIAIETIAAIVATKGGTLFLKRHPSDLETYPGSAKNVQVVEAPIGTLLEACDACVTFLTKVAFVSVAANKPTVTLALNTAARSGATVHAEHVSQWSSAIDQALALTPAELDTRREQMAAFLGWLDRSFYVNSDVPVDFARPSVQSIIDRIDGSEPGRKASGSISRNQIRIVDAIKAARQSKKAKGNMVRDKICVAFDVSRLSNTRLEYSGISRYAKRILDGLRTRPELDVVPILFKPQILSRGAYRGDMDGFSKFLGHPVLTVADGKKYIAGKTAVYFSPYDELHDSLPGVPRAVTVHDILHISASEWYLDPRARAHIDNVLSKIGPDDHVVSDSEFTRMDLVQQKLATEAQITTIYLAAEDTFFPAPASAVKTFCTQNNLKIGKYFVLFGQFEFRKNVPTTLSAIRRAIMDKGSKSQFLIIGSGINSEAMQLALERADLPPETVRFIAAPDDKTLALAYSGARGTLYVSLGEGFGLPIAESLACGCPTITTGVTSVPEVARDAALYVDPRSPDQIADAIIALERSDSLYQQLSASALKSASRFSWKRTVEELTDLLCSLALPVKVEQRAETSPERVDPSARALGISARLLLDLSLLQKQPEDPEIEKIAEFIGQFSEDDPVRCHFFKVLNYVKQASDRK